MNNRTIPSAALRLFFLLASTIFLAGCATQGMLGESETAYITNVVVTKSRPDLGSVNIIEDIRVKTIQQARRFPAGGRSKTAKVLLTHFRAKDGLRGLLVSDVSTMLAVVTIIDNQTNKVDGSFEVGVQDAARAGGGVIGLIVTGFDSPLWVEQRLAGDLAEKIMVNFYGSDRAKNPAPLGPLPTANYPAKYKDLLKKNKCQSAMKFPTAETSGGDEEAPPAKCT